MTFRETMATVLTATRLNTAYFAQTVTYRLADGTELETDAHVRHGKRLDSKPDGTTEVIEQIRVELARAEFESPPDFGDRILLSGDEYGYLYAGAGRHTPVSWKATFERRQRKSQGAGKAKAA